MQIILYKVLEKSLRVLHPIMPFITEEIWQRLPREHHLDSIMISPWPHLQSRIIDKDAEEKMQSIIDIIVAVRNIRQAHNIPHSKKLDVEISCPTKKAVDLAGENLNYIKALAGIENVKVGIKLKAPEAKGVVKQVVGKFEIFVKLADIAKDEIKRLLRQRDEIISRLDLLKERFKNKDFISKAPKNIIEAEETKKKDLQESLKKINGYLKDFGVA